MPVSRHLQLSEIAVGFFCTGLGLFVLVGVARAPASAANSAVGPGVFPTIIGIGLVAVGLRLFYEAWTRRNEPSGFPSLDLGSAAFGAAAFVGMILTLEWLGWIIAGTLLYLAVAVAFGTRRIAMTLLLGLVLTSATWLLFDYGLDLSLPTGEIVERVLSSFNPDT